MLRSRFIFSILFLLTLTTRLSLGNDIFDRGEEHCVEDRCRHGGRCIEQKNEFGISIVKCECKLGFYGVFCEIKENPILSLLLNDPPYMHSTKTKDPWGKRYETEGIRPLFDGTRKTLLDIMQRFYRNVLELQRARDTPTQTVFFQSK
ncbi:hypothetical protein M3Y94_00840500 [Aphelenchoides besseyi]|nr:hypothetical protein M3Y94_00840500 [Aphelenchoides besseyi]KAI6226929.1 hypothetical protein M3Y95_00673100 [Aphelenchoides besseyi]